MSSINDQLAALGFPGCTVWYGNPPFDAEPNKVRFQIGPLWVDFPHDSGPIPAPPSYETIIAVIIPPTKDEADLSALKGMANVITLINLTPAQADAYIDANVTDLASARAAMKLMLKAILLAARAVLK